MQGVNVLVLGMGDKQGMETIGRKAASITLAAGAHGLKIAGIDCRDNELMDSGGVGRCVNNIPVGVEFGSIEMAVGIDPFGQKALPDTGYSSPRARLTWMTSGIRRSARMICSR